MAKKETPTDNQKPNPSLYEVAGTVDKSLKMVEVNSMEGFPIYGTEAFEDDKPIRGNYLGTQTRGTDNKGNPRVVQVFANPKSGEKFGFWSKAGLDSRLVNVQPNTTVDVYYDGKGPHPTDPEKTLHQFRIQAPEGSAGATV